MKRQRLEMDNRPPPAVPAFLQPHSKGKGPAWAPAWGIRKNDTVVGSTKASKDWSFYGVSPKDYTDIVVNGEIDNAETLGAQGLATVYIFLSLLFFINY